MPGKPGGGNGVTRGADIRKAEALACGREALSLALCARRALEAVGDEGLEALAARACEALADAVESMEARL